MKLVAMTLVLVAWLVGPGDGFQRERPVSPEKASAETKKKRAAVNRFKDNLEGKAPPALTVDRWRNTDGKALAWSDLRGKVVLLDFWGVWCGPCKASIPHLLELYRANKDRGFVVIGVHTTFSDGKQADVFAEFFKARKIDYPVAVDVDWKSVRAYAVDGYPDYYLIGRDGKVRFADLANQELDRALEHLLIEGEAGAKPDAREKPKSGGKGKRADGERNPRKQD
jgi:thiol-disulfide isomerase/thioredoxin